jgi:hypothetical protein
METKKNHFDSGRRKFLTRHLPAGALMCLGCKSLLASTGLPGGTQEAVQKSKYQLNSGMTTEDVFKFTYGYSLPVYQYMEKKIGKEKLIELLKGAAAENSEALMKSFTKGVPGNMKDLSAMVKTWMSSPPYNNAFSYTITEESDNILEMKYTECPAAKFYREMNASDIGYAIECSGSDKMAKAFNPKMEAKSSKNMLKGDDVCIERFILKT